MPLARPISSDLYRAQGVSKGLLQSIMWLTGAINASDQAAKAGISTVPHRDDDHPLMPINAAQVHALTAHMLAIDAGERHPVGPYDLIALRFVVEDAGGAAVSLLAVEGYSSPYPALVDGHCTDRTGAISAWLGDADASEHPDLYLEDLA